MHGMGMLNYYSPPKLSENISFSNDLNREQKLIISVIFA